MAGTKWVRRAVPTIVANCVLWFVVVPLFERWAPRGMVRAYQRATAPFFRVFAGFVPGFGVVETIGRRTGKPRRTPVGGRLIGDSFWFVAGVGREALYVRNIEADPRIRVKTIGRWWCGTARLCPDDDSDRRMFVVNPANGLFLLLAGGDPLSVRVDLDRSAQDDPLVA